MESRILKFRAWDTTKAKMFFGGGVGVFGDDTFSLDYGNGKMCMGCAYPMQYIGLEDKNDEEIYEGDIVAMSKKDYGVIYYRADGEGVGFFIKWVKQTQSWNDLIYVRIDEIEVIGNIYANPELLK